jgi:hypothetical protein
LLTTECGTALTALFLLVPAVDKQLPVDPVPLLAGVVTACGSVPQPTTQLHCGVDDTVSATLRKLLGPLSILLAIVNTQAAAPAAEEVGVIQQYVPAALTLVDITKLAETALQCSGAAPPQRPGAQAAQSSSPPPTTLALAAPSPSSLAPSSLAAEPIPSLSHSSSPRSLSVPAVRTPLVPAPVVAPITNEIAVTPRKASTPIGSALYGLLLILVIAAVVFARLNRELAEQSD